MPSAKIDLMSLVGEKVLVHKNGKVEEVSSSTLGSKTIGLYFSAHWCPPCRRFTPLLKERYEKLQAKGTAFEILFVSSDRDPESFQEYFSEMPWAAVPFTDTTAIAKIKGKFKIQGIPTFVVIGPDGTIINGNARQDVTEDEDVDNFPWVPPPKLTDGPVDLAALLGPKLLLRKAGKSEEVDTADVLGKKTVGVYFSAHWCPPCQRFTPMLAERYNKLKEKGTDFEVVFISSDRSAEDFQEYFSHMPWAAVPYASSETIGKLKRSFDIEGIPTLFILGPDGALINGDAVQAVAEDDQCEQFPWAPPPKVTHVELASLLGPQLLVHKEGSSKAAEVDSAGVVGGKTVGLYFSAHWCPPCQRFTPLLKQRYEKLKAMGNKPFEVVYVSSDNSQEEFEEYFSGMPWAAVPFGSKEVLKGIEGTFHVEGIPTLVMVAANGDVLGSDTVAAVAGDEECEEFPWGE